MALPFSLAAVWALFWLLLHGELYQPFIDTHLSAANAFVVGLVVSFVSIALFEVIFFLVFIRVHRISSPREFFKVETLDVKGIWLCFSLGLVVQILNGLFLWNLVLKPARDFLVSHGLGGGLIGLGSGGAVPHLTPALAAFLTVFLLLFWWLELPEEVFFRGYLQNQIQRVVGKNAAAVISAAVWDLSHLFGLANVLERFLYGLVYGIVFRFRQNATPTMIVHPLSNRALLLAVVAPQVFGLSVEPNSPAGLLLLLGIYVLLLVCAIAGWRLLRLDATRSAKV